MKKRQYRSNQGRNPEKNKETYKVLEIALIGLFMSILILIFISI
jgi:hypothetical protein